MHSTWCSSPFLKFWKFLQIEKRWHIFLRGKNSAERLNNLCPLLYFTNLNGPDSESFIGFQCILHGAAVFLSVFQDLVKFKKGHLFTGQNKFYRTAELFDPPLFISILTIWKTQILHHSLDFNPYSRWAFAGLLTDGGSGAKGPHSP